MSHHDTRDLNRDRSDIEALDEIWLFGYGSLIYKVDFPFIASCDAYLLDWERRFWQGSHDHRGTPAKPGRVLTLIPSPGARCYGVAYRVALDVFDHLDHREKNGYLRQVKPLVLADQSIKPGVVYVGLPSNPAFLGDAPDKEIAQQIFNSEGLSGMNRDYVHQLADALRERSVKDDHVFTIDQLLRDCT